VSAADRGQDDAAGADVRLRLIEAGFLAHDAGRLLWAGGERSIAPDCFRIAARCGLPEAEADLLVWEHTDGAAIADGSRAPGERRRPRRAVTRRIPPVAAGLILAVGLWTTFGPQFPSRPPSQPADLTVGGQQLDAAPIEPIFAPVTQDGSPARPSTGPPEPRDRSAPVPAAAEVEIDRPRTTTAKDVLVELSSDRLADSAPAADECKWSLVKSSADGQDAAAPVVLGPGQSQVYRVQAGEWSSLRVVPDAGGARDGCTVVKVEQTPVAVARTPMLRPPTPTPTDPGRSSAPAEDPAPSGSAGPPPTVPAGRSAATGPAGGSAPAEPPAGTPPASPEPTPSAY
jgi:hypothetical protein